MSDDALFGPRRHGPPPDDRVPRGPVVIRIGVAGWDYPDWNGVVYPTGEARPADRLTHLSRFVDVIEINSSFYRPVAARAAESWIRRTEEAARDGFTFTAKAHRSWTHEPPVDLDSSIAATLHGLQPLRQFDRLGAVLLQFPQSFHYSTQSVEHLERLLERLADWPAVVEVRHASWDSDAAADWFRRHGVGWCAVDQPRVGGSTLPVLPRVTARLAYLRLHGRNAADWFRADAGRDQRYDYLYGARQLERLAGAAREMAGAAEELFVIQNNHFRGQALVNALQMKHLLQGGRPAAPETLVAAYPELASVVKSDTTRLF
jgi:uncharacterized protein YecE (DUF72 family)